jgi:trk system potassium uptake protein TrkH
LEQGWKHRVGDRVIRQARRQEREPILIEESEPRRRNRRFESPVILIYGFGSLIAIGTLLLWLPYFNTTGRFTPFLTALFTATSASTVTGLVVVDTATHWSRAGQGVLMVLMEVGGLGFMSTATFLLVIITQRVTVANQLIMREFLGISRRSGLLRLSIQVVSMSLFFQLAGFLIFLWRFLPIFEPGEAVWQALFLAVSGFNNAGFNIIPESASVVLFRKEMWVIGSLTALIIVGGISYSVLAELVRFKRFSRFSLDSRMVVILSLVLWLLGAMVFFVSEFGNDATLKGLPLGSQVIDSVFHSVSGRTAGFTTIDFVQTEQHTNFFFTGLMFIGGASGSTAGGIKVNTMAVILVAVMASIRGRAQVEVSGREIPAAQIQRALAIAFLGIGFVFIVAFFLVVTEGFPFNDILFETVSAFGTVGLSSGITAGLSVWGKSLLASTMFVGRLGPLTMALALGEVPQRAIYRYSQERVRIG